MFKILLQKRGKRQMLAMGRALMSEPKFLMMDEPTAGLAPKLGGEVFEFIKHLRELGLTSLVVEEKVEHALKASDRAYVLQNGSIVFDGTSAEVRRSGSILKAYIGGIIKSANDHLIKKGRKLSGGGWR